MFATGEACSHRPTTDATAAAVEAVDAARSAGARSENVCSLDGTGSIPFALRVVPVNCVTAGAVEKVCLYHKRF